MKGDKIMKPFLAAVILLCSLPAPLVAALAGQASEGENPVLKNIHQRKSVRHYLDQPVPREKIELLLKAGMAAPTAADRRPWAFVAVTDQAQLRALAAALPFGKMLNQAGAAVAVCGLPKKSLAGKESEYWIQDCSAASENILLAAESLGLGAVWLGVHPVADRVAAVRKALGIPAEAVPLNVISIGVPAGGEQPKNKFNPANIHWEKW